MKIDDNQNTFTSLGERLLAKWRRPRSLTVVAPVAGTTVEGLRLRLSNLEQSFLDTLQKVDDLHSFRLVAVPPDIGFDRSTRVLLNIVHDEPLEMHLVKLIQAAGDPLAEAFVGADFSGSPDDLPKFFMRYRLRENTVHLGAINKTVNDILGEDRLREKIEIFIDDQMGKGACDDLTDVRRIQQQIKKYISENAAEEDLPSAPSGGLTQSARILKFMDLIATFAFPAMGVLAQDTLEAIGRIKNKIHRAAAGLAYVMWWLYGGIFTGLALLGVRLLEIMEPDIEAPQPDEETLRRLEATEDLRLKNEVTLWFPVKNSWMRRLLLALILWGSERGCRHFWTVGHLANIDTIHYARLLQVDKGRSMIFMSDYDGSLHRYLDDFIGVGSRAVVPISSNFEGCPKTRWLFGQQDPDTFDSRWRNLIRRYQLEASVWYSAYPLLTVRDIQTNSEIRDGLFAEDLSNAEMQRWARKF